MLAEMIKLSELDVGVLVNLVKSHGIQPDWMHMQLPGGKFGCYGRLQAWVSNPDQERAKH